jgi:hypothetical protein
MTDNDRPGRRWYVVGLGAATVFFVIAVVPTLAFAMVKETGQVK